MKRLRVEVWKGDNHAGVQRPRAVHLCEDGKPDLDIAPFVHRLSVEFDPHVVKMTLYLPPGIAFELVEVPKPLPVSEG